MTLASFKTAAQVITGTLIKQVFFDYSQIKNIERTKLYPYVLWDFNTWKGSINWANTTHKRERLKVNVFCVDYFDRGAATETQSREAVWDDIRGYFRTYCDILDNNQYISILNLNSMPYEYYSIGLSVDAEIGVRFELELELFC